MAMPTRISPGFGYEAAIFREDRAVRRLELLPGWSRGSLTGAIAREELSVIRCWRLLAIVAPMLVAELEARFGEQFRPPRDTASEGSTTPTILRRPRVKAKSFLPINASDRSAVRQTRIDV